MPALVLVLTILGLLLLIAGCAKQKRREPMGAVEAWHKARGYFDRERYYRAREILNDVVLNYPGALIIDSVQFYLARTGFELEDYITAADEFKRVVDQYPYSALAGDAVYWQGRSYFAQSPSYQLDQEYTNKALQSLQRFMEDYPGHALTDSAYRYLALCREKLARKEYTAASLYYDLGEYASAILYADLVLSDYYDTPLAEPAQFLKARAFVALREWPRARAEVETYLQKYPKGRFAVRARQLQNGIPSAPGSASSP